MDSDDKEEILDEFHNIACTGIGYLAGGDRICEAGTGKGNRQSIRATSHH